MKVDKKQLIKTLALCLLGLALFAGAGVLLVFDIVEKTSFKEKIMYGSISGALSLLCIVTAAMFIYSYYQQNVKPNKDSDDTKSDYDIKREAEIHKKLPGKDMFDVIRQYRRRNYTTRVCAIAFSCVLIVCLFLVKISGEMHMDYRISIGVSILTIVIAFGIAGRNEFSYSREIDFKKAIAKNGADKVRLNADFMMGSHFCLKDGLAVLGRDYLVIFAKALCEVLNVEDISLVTKDCISQQVQGMYLTIFRLKITFKNKSFLWIGLKDGKETDLMLGEFRKLNIPCDQSPAVTDLENKSRQPAKRSKYE